MDKDTTFLLLMGMAALLLFRSKNVLSPEENRQLYKPAFKSAGEMHNVPADLLERVAQQESAFRSDIIHGQTKSSAGAMGIMQIVPRWHPDVNPLDPVEAIHYAAEYLRKLYDKYGNWGNALQAYNWGPGNLDRFLAGDITTMPTETINYFTEITNDTGLV